MIILEVLRNTIHEDHVVVGVKLRDAGHGGRSMIAGRTPVRACVWALKEPSLHQTPAPLAGPLPRRTSGRGMEADGKYAGL